MLHNGPVGAHCQSGCSNGWSIGVTPGDITLTSPDDTSCHGWSIGLTVYAMAGRGRHPFIIDLGTQPGGEEYYAYNVRRWGGDGWTQDLRRSGKPDGATFSNWKRCGLTGA